MPDEFDIEGLVVKLLVGAVSVSFLGSTLVGVVKIVTTF
jgi:hypothetical protein